MEIDRSKCLQAVSSWWPGFTTNQSVRALSRKMRSESCSSRVCQGRKVGNVEGRRCGGVEAKSSLRAAPFNSTRSVLVCERLPTQHGRMFQVHQESRHIPAQQSGGAYSSECESDRTTCQPPCSRAGVHVQAVSTLPALTSSTSFACCCSSPLKNATCRSGRVSGLGCRAEVEGWGGRLQVRPCTVCLISCCRSVCKSVACVAIASRASESRFWVLGRRASVSQTSMWPNTASKNWFCIRHTPLPSIHTLQSLHSLIFASITRRSSMRLALPALVPRALTCEPMGDAAGNHHHAIVRGAPFASGPPLSHAAHFCEKSPSLASLVRTATY